MSATTRDSLNKAFIMKLILLGPPGAGKGTQAELLAKQFAIPTVSTGAIIRASVAAGGENGKKLASYIEKGLLVPDEVVIDVIKERLAESDCANGYILDGFPRTVAQAQALKTMGIAIDGVVDIELDDEKIVNRLSGRRECSVCHAPYHVTDKKPKVEGICDSCGGTLVQRADDEPETIRTRLGVYHEQTEPLVSFYKGEGILKTVSGEGSVEDITKAIVAALS